MTNEIATRGEAPALMSRDPRVVAANQMSRLMEAALASTDMDLDRMERLMGLMSQAQATAAEAQAEEARREFDAAMARVQALATTVAKNKKADRYSYADLAAVSDAITPLAAAEGLNLKFLPTAASKPGLVALRYILSHSSGHREEDVMELAIDGGRNMSGAQAWGSVSTYARRYCMMALYNVSTADDDGRQAPPFARALDVDTLTRLRDLIGETGQDESAILGFGGVDRLDDMPAGKARQSIARLEKRLAEAKASAEKAEEAS